MKSQIARSHNATFIAAIAAIAAVALTTSHAAVTVDGVRDGVEGYTELALQPYTSAFGVENAIANLHTEQSGKLLNLFIGGRANGNAILIFIDSKAGGVQTITNNSIASGGFESDINNLASGSGTGMNFESTFQPDSAIRIYGAGAEAYISRYDLQTRVRTDLGRADLATVSNGPVTSAMALWSDVSVDSSGYSSVTNGVEISLNMALLGVAEGNQTVKVMAILVNSDSTYGSNHVLGALDTDMLLAQGVRGFDFEAHPGTQTLSILVNCPSLVGLDDEDGDGLSNNLDPFPLDQTRNITFSVNMNVESLKGDFAPPSSVQAQFFSGGEAALSTLNLNDLDADGIYIGTLENAKGFSGSSFGTYKFVTNDSNNTNSGYELGSDRSFALGAPVVTQVLPTVFFSNVTTLPYSDWSSANAGGGSASQDFDNDGVQNGVEYFMGEKGSLFTPNPQAVAGLISWPHSSAAVGASFKVWTSESLTTWTDVTLDAVDSAGTVKYTIPTITPKLFVRLEVTAP